MINIKINWIEPYKTWTNWKSEIFTLNDKKYDYNLFIDRLPKTHKSMGNKNIIWLYEPKVILHGLHRRIRSGSVPKNINAIFTCDEDVALEIKQQYNIRTFVIPPYFKPWIQNEQIQIYSKTKLVSMIASTRKICSGHEFRQIIADFSEKNNVDLFGRGRSKEIENKVDGVKDYMFSIAMENSIINTYYTEKILDCFLTGTVPIYWGTNKIGEIFDKRGILHFNNIEELKNILETLSTQKYFEMLPYIQQNFDKAKKLKSEEKHAVEHILEILIKENI